MKSQLSSKKVGDTSKIDLQEGSPMETDEKKHFIVYKIYPVVEGLKEEEINEKRDVSLCDELVWIATNRNDNGTKTAVISSCVGNEERYMTPGELWMNWLVMANVLKDENGLKPEYKKICAAVVNVINSECPFEAKEPKAGVN